MYRCPHCRDLSISWRAQFSPPFDGRTKCPSCGAELKIKLKVSNLLLAIYLGGRGLLGLLFDIRFDPGLFWEIWIVVILAFLQVRLSAYREVSGPKHYSH